MFTASTTRSATYSAIAAIVILLFLVLQMAPPSHALSNQDNPARSQAILAPVQTCGDTFEPNESFAQAADTQIGIYVEGHICTATDEDWFKFDISAGQTIEVDLTDLPADYDLVLYSPDEKSVADSLNSNTADEHIEHVATESGSYRIRIKSYGGAHSSNPYSLLISIITPSCGDSFESNEGFGSATAVSDQEIIEAYICTANDEDWFKFDVVAGQSIDVGLTGLPADYDLYLLKPDNTAAEDSRHTGTEDERIIHTATASGSYRVRVAGYRGAYSAADYYTLRILVSTPTCNDTNEPNESFAAARTIPLHDNIDGAICTAADEDWYKFSVFTGQTIEIVLSSLPADYDLYLLDPSGAEVDNSRETGTKDEHIVHVAKKTGWYHMQIIGYNHAYADDYYMFYADTTGGPSVNALYLPIIQR